MSLIKREKTAVIKRLSVRMEADLLDSLTQYSNHMDSSKDHVVSEAVRYIITRDKEFTEKLNLPQNPPTILGGNLGEIVGRNLGEIPQQKAVGK